MNAIDQNPNKGMFDLWGPLWNQINMRFFADDATDGGGGGGDDDGDDDPDNDDSKKDDSQTDEDAKTDADKKSAETAKAEAIDVSKKFDEELSKDEEDEDKLDDDKIPSGDDKKGDDKKGDDKDSAQKNADDKDSRDDAEKEEQQDDKKEITDELLERAVTAGLSLSDARSFGSPESLERTLDIVEKSRADAGDQTSKDKTGKTDTENKDTADSQFKPFEVKPFELTFDKEDEIEPDIAKGIKAVNEQGTEQLKAMNEHYTGQFKNMAELLQKSTTQMQALQSALDQQSTAKFETEFEAQIEGLGDEYEDLVGKGIGGDLDKDGPQMVNRNKIIRAMRFIDKDTFEAGKSLLSQDKVFKQAVGMVFSDKAKELATKKVADKVKARGKQSIDRASASKGKSLTPHGEAVQVSKDFDAKLDEEDE